MKYLLSMALIMLFCEGSAQERFVEAYVDRLSISDSWDVLNDSVVHNEQTSWNFLPVVGFYATNNKKMGYGLKLGFTKVEVNNPSNSNVDNVKYDDLYNSENYTLYICPLMLERFILTKYEIWGSIALPITYQYSYRVKLETDQRDATTGAILFQSKTLYEYPSQLNIGLFANGIVYRRFGKRWFLGAGARVGVLGTFVKGDVEINTAYFRDNAYSESSSKIRGAAAGFQLQIQPAVSMLYKLK
jgi:hypothetical protein